MKDRQRRVKELAHNWDEFGRTDPMWAVLTSPQHRGGRWDQDSFFETGRQEIDELFRDLSAKEIAIDRRLAVDFGCGVGRLSRALSTRFDRVLGLDISESMVANAAKMNSDVENCEFRCNRSPNLSAIKNQTVTFLYSNLVLQHIAPPLNQDYLSEFLRVLAPGGYAAFHVPVANDWSFHGVVFRLVPNRVLNLWRRRHYGVDAVMEMHDIPAPEVQRIVDRHGCRVVDTSTSEQGGAGWITNRYVVSRPIEG